MNLNLLLKIYTILNTIFLSLVILKFKFRINQLF